MAGHLMVYPYHISETGAVTYLGSEVLPDTKTAKVIAHKVLQGTGGSASAMLNVYMLTHPLCGAAWGPDACAHTSAGAWAKVCDTALSADHMSQKSLPIKGRVVLIRCC